LSGLVTVSKIDLDPLIVSALHLSGLTGHSEIVGQFGMSGSLLQPDMISVDANLTQVSLDYEYIKLQNQGPVQFQYGNLQVTVRHGSFPAGLSQLAGDFIFDASRVSFNDVTSETGGGRLLLSGSLTYGNGPASYDLTARTEQVRVRYPAGMSWLAGGDLRLLGTTQSAALSGRVTVDRLLMSEGFDITSLVASSTETTSGPRATSPFLRNLQFDVQADTTPGAVLECSSGRFQAGANV